MGLAAIVADVILAGIVIGSALYTGRRAPGRHRGAVRDDDAYAELVRWMDRRMNDQHRSVIRELGRIRMQDRDTLELNREMIRGLRNLKNVDQHLASIDDRLADKRRTDDYNAGYIDGAAKRAPADRSVN